MMKKIMLPDLYLLQPYQRDPDIARFQACRRAGRRNAVTEEDFLTIPAVVAQHSSQAADSSITGASSEHVSSTQTTDAGAATLPADISKLKFDGKDL